MSNLADSKSTEASNDPRKMGKLVRSYAQNRSLGVVVGLVIFLILFAAIAGPSYFGGMAYRYSQWPFFWLCMAILVIAIAATVYLSVPRWGGKMIQRLTLRLYTGEGNVQLSCPMSGGRKLVGWCSGGDVSCLHPSNGGARLSGRIPRTIHATGLRDLLRPFFRRDLVASASCRWAYYATLARTLCPACDFDYRGGPNLVCWSLGFAQHAHSHNWLRVNCQFNCPYLQPDPASKTPLHDSRQSFGRSI